MNIRAIAPADDPTHTTDRLSRAAPLPLAVMLAGKGAVFVLPGVVTAPVKPAPVGTAPVGTITEGVTVVGSEGVKVVGRPKTPEGKSKSPEENWFAKSPEENWFAKSPEENSFTKSPEENWFAKSPEENWFVGTAGTETLGAAVAISPPMMYTDVVGTTLLTMTAVQTLGLPLTEGPHD
jgi:hypothetical protein